MELLPHVNGALNVALTVFIVLGFIAIRRGDRRWHPRWMLSATATGVLFLVGYVAQVLLLGHARFPGDDWVRTLFVVVLATHTLLAVSVPFLVGAMIWLAVRENYERHRRLARWAFPIWLYVATTGVFIYLMNNHVRPVP